MLFMNNFKLELLVENRLDVARVVANSLCNWNFCKYSGDRLHLLISDARTKSCQLQKPQSLEFH